jgi:hypothetical protein
LTEKKTLIFEQADIDDFKKWLSLNMDSLTWQGRYQSQFDEFWDTFFVEGLSLRQLSERFEFIIGKLKSGPLVVWLNWLKEKLLCYVFIKFDCTIESLSHQAKIDIGTLSIIIRDMLMLDNAHLDDELSELFLISNDIDEGAQVTLSKIRKKYDIGLSKIYLNSEDLMKSLEVTLYPEWKDINVEIKKAFFHKNFDFDALSSKRIWGKQLGFLRDVVLLTFVGLVLVFVTQYFNKKWEESLANQISIYEPQFKWLNKVLTFRPVDEVDTNTDIELSANALEEVKDKFKEIGMGEDDEIRYDVESEVVLTSWDSLPKDLEGVSQEQSEYEELKKRGYRESRYGNTKVYRILLKSEDTPSSKNKLNHLLERYDVTQVDNVAPGKEVPGGIYYNLFVPRKYLKEFIAQVTDSDNAVLYESRTRAGRNPPGKNKVFIWVKSI